MHNRLRQLLIALNAAGFATEAASLERQQQYFNLSNMTAFRDAILSAETRKRLIPELLNYGFGWVNLEEGTNYWGNVYRRLEVIDWRDYA